VVGGFGHDGIVAVTTPLPGSSERLADNHGVNALPPSPTEASAATEAPTEPGPSRAPQAREGLPAAGGASGVAPVPLIDDPTAPLFVFFALRGRVSRRTFWLYGVLALLGLAVLGHALLGIAGAASEHADAIVNLLLLWLAIAVSAKRWQDRNRAPWWVLVTLVPVVGWIWALVDNGFVRGTPGINRYGAPPSR
jgi:uncharacterized membrane protein YhaH (DUF805 family)